LSTTVLQGSVAMRMNYGKIFNDLFIANLLLSVTVKEFWRSVRIRQSYGKKIKWHLFFRTRCSILLLVLVLCLQLRLLYFIYYILYGAIQMPLLLLLQLLLPLLWLQLLLHLWGQ